MSLPCIYYIFQLPASQYPTQITGNQIENDKRHLLRLACWFWKNPHSTVIPTGLFSQMVSTREGYGSQNWEGYGYSTGKISAEFAWKLSSSSGISFKFDTLYLNHQEIVLQSHATLNRRLRKLQGAKIGQVCNSIEQIFPRLHLVLHNTAEIGHKIELFYQGRLKYYRKRTSTFVNTFVNINFTLPSFHILYKFTRGWLFVFWSTFSRDNRDGNYYNFPLELVSKNVEG